MSLTKVLKSIVVATLPQSVVGSVRRLRARLVAPPMPQLGSVQLGSLARLNPISEHFGLDRGTPIDRHYIEAFLGRHRSVIRGRALEIGDDSYCRQFGGSAVTQQDILHVSGKNPKATIVGDLSQPGLLPQASFDCMVVTQTLHLILDMPAAVREMYRALRPGGVLLLTVPGISPIARDEWAENWFWSLTAQSAARLFGEVFGAANVEVTASGNVYAATSFLHGLAVEDIDPSCLEFNDPSYPVTVAVRAMRSE